MVEVSLCQTNLYFRYSSDGQLNDNMISKSEVGLKIESYFWILIRIRFDANDWITLFRCRSEKEEKLEMDEKLFDGNLKILGFEKWHNGFGLTCTYSWEDGIA